MNNLVTYYSNNVIQLPYLNLVGHFRAIVCTNAELAWENPLSVGGSPFISQKLYISKRLNCSVQAFKEIQSVFEHDTKMYTSVLEVDTLNTWKCTRKCGFNYEKEIQNFLNCANFDERSEKEKKILLELFPKKIEDLRGKLAGKNLVSEAFYFFAFFSYLYSKLEMICMN